MNFSKCGISWEQGVFAENIVARYFREDLGMWITPLCSIESGGAPVMRNAVARAVLPDFQVALMGKSELVEVKYTNAPYHFKKDNEWQIYLSKWHFEQYEMVAKEFGMEASICFYVKKNDPHPEAPDSPHLLLARLEVLKRHASFNRYDMSFENKPFPPGTRMAFDVDKTPFTKIPRPDELPPIFNVERRDVAWEHSARNGDTAREIFLKKERRKDDQFKLF